MDVVSRVDTAAAAPVSMLDFKVKVSASKDSAGVAHEADVLALGNAVPGVDKGTGAHVAVDGCVSGAIDVVGDGYPPAEGIAPAGVNHSA